jgi:DNA-binding FadR family transcriptional regulator
VIDEPIAFAAANARFHEGLVAATGNETLVIVVETLDEVVTRAVAAVAAGEDGDAEGSIATRRRAVRSQEKLATLIAAGDADGAEAHWRMHMGVVARVLLRGQAETVIDLLDHF